MVAPLRAVERQHEVRKAREMYKSHVRSDKIELVETRHRQLGPDILIEGVEGHDRSAAIGAGAAVLWVVDQMLLRYYAEYASMSVTQRAAFVKLVLPDRLHLLKQQGPRHRRHAVGLPEEVGLHASKQGREDTVQLRQLVRQPRPDRHVLRRHTHAQALLRKENSGSGEKSFDVVRGMMTGGSMQQVIQLADQVVFDDAEACRGSRPLRAEVKLLTHLEHLDGGRRALGGGLSSKRR